MNPRHRGIDTLDEYAYWVDQTIHERGGALDHGYLDVEEITDSDGKAVGHLYRRQWFSLAHGVSIGFDKFIDADLVVVEYHYQYAAPHGQLVVELHNHRGHERDVGGRSHMHVHDGDDRRTVLAPIYDFDEALDFFAVWPISD